MFDDLRRATEPPEPFEEEEEMAFDTFEQAMPERRIFGMTAGQRFVISLLLFGTVAVLGAMCLVVTQAIWLF